MNEKKYYSVAEVALLLGVSRITIFKRIKAGVLRAIKVGRAYTIPREEIDIIVGITLTDEKKRKIEAGVKKVVSEYGETLKMLGNE